MNLALVRDKLYVIGQFRDTEEYVQTVYGAPPECVEKAVDGQLSSALYELLNFMDTDDDNALAHRGDILLPLDPEINHPIWDRTVGVLLADWDGSWDTYLTMDVENYLKIVR